MRVVRHGYLASLFLAGVFFFAGSAPAAFAALGAAAFFAFEASSAAGASAFAFATTPAFFAARTEGRSSVDCYIAGVKVQRSLHPEYHPAYAAKIAVRTMIKSEFGNHVAAILDRPSGQPPENFDKIPDSYKSSHRKYSGKKTSAERRKS